MKTQTRVAATFFLFSVVTIAVLSSTVYYFLDQYSFTDFYKRLEIRAVVAAKSALDHENDKAVLQEVRNQHLEKLPEEKDYFFRIDSVRDFRTEARKLKVDESFFTRALREGTAEFQSGNIFFSGIRYRSHAGADYIVVVSAENYYNSHHLAYVRNVFVIAIVATMVFALLISILLSRRVFRPVKEITGKVKEISSQSLHLRLEPYPVKDELGELSSTFNNMLDRLETAFEIQNNFISNASHELRTPLTAIIGEAEVALVKERTAQEYQAALNAILAEAERLEQITGSLLFLAQTGFKGKQQRLELVRTDELLWAVKGTIERMNPQCHIQINLSLMPESPEKLKIYGNEQLLHLALVNIVSNACKYSNNAPVMLSIGTSDDSVIIVVKDSGIGIPGKDLEHIYDPFFRASNTQQYEGYGIGLPLTRNIVRIHDGEILVTSDLGEGTTVQLRFPAAFRQV